MRWRGEFTEERPKPGFPYIWSPARLARCPRTACRRAARCVRPEMVEGRGPPNWPSCPLVTDEEWSVWGTALLRIMLRRQKERWAEEEAVMRAEQEARRRKR
jgi:hypothetical protein